MASKPRDAADDLALTGGTTEAPAVMPLEEVAPRVLEIERLAALGCRLAREALENPETTARTQERLTSILREVGELIPTLHLAGAPVDPNELIVPSLHGAPPPDAAPEAVDRGSAPVVDDGEHEGGEDEQEEWDFDPKVLEAALANDTFMAEIPETEREWFKTLAQRVLDSHARATFATRVREALGALYETMERCQAENSKRLSVALTFEHLRLANTKKLD